MAPRIVHFELSAADKAIVLERHRVFGDYVSRAGLSPGRGAQWPRVVSRREPGIAVVMGELLLSCAYHFAPPAVAILHTYIVAGSTPPPRTPNPLDERTLVGGVVV